MNLHDIADWAARNQRWLSARLAYWRARIDALAEDADASAHAHGVPDDADDGFEPAARRLAASFGLSAFEMELLVLAAGVEIDAAIRDALARAQRTPAGHPVRVGFALALRLLPQPHWDAVSPLAPLRAWSLVDFDASGGFTHATMRIDERILHALTGVAAFDPRLAGIARRGERADDAAYPDLARSIARALAAQPHALIVLADARLDAEHVRGGRRLASAALSRAGLGTLWVDASSVNGDPRETAEIARRLDREAVLSQAGVVVSLDDDEASHRAAALGFAGRLNGPTLVLGAPGPLALAALERPVLRFGVPRAPATLRPDVPAHMHAIARRAIRQFRVDPSVLEQALGAVTDFDDATAEPTLWQALREAARGGLDTLAQRIDSRTAFDDLVLPPFVAAQLREIAAQLRDRQTVYDDWGFGRGQTRGLGIAALFAGESGTGKTMAAEAIANAARVDLYRIDLSSVVNKYIGETEKNLARLFDAAETSGAILLFDEADALFGRRSDVKDSHDRYANIEVAYLLQRIETYRGLAILTTNMKSALDRAFLRRIRFVVNFPFPDAAARESIWRRQFPAAAPLGAIDFGALARLNLAGGHIRSVALNAAFKAAGGGGAIDQAALMDAARAEYAKLERSFNGPAGGRA
ncbi:ATPase associated with various cellular activities family protein [Burkholderia thailandensis MSMB121]|uniref:AAA family ATPase n=1 Tax=Burkholderia humptydooensis TaxID=430531 RepID=UPI00032804CB|nr:ATP-binding protein [Burkholderia humptydooensis]AGK49687.1 ATPase associated with various cellular activities family protein [Burkholderia thailandensis MSMB121]ATF32507.1 ATP-binding protein [Burkholderia thailandensis]KST70601.1 AAA family ATPase [Burkholderia humptydooensis]